MIFDAFVATLLSLLLFVKGRSTKPSCCPKVDPDAFRNVVSILIFQFFLEDFEGCFLFEINVAPQRTFMVAVLVKR